MKKPELRTITYLDGEDVFALLESRGRTDARHRWLDVLGVHNGAMCFMPDIFDYLECPYTTEFHLAQEMEKDIREFYFIYPEYAETGVHLKFWW